MFVRNVFGTVVFFRNPHCKHRGKDVDYQIIISEIFPFSLNKVFCSKEKKKSETIHVHFPHSQNKQNYLCTQEAPRVFVPSPLKEKRKYIEVMVKSVFTNIIMHLQLLILHRLNSNIFFRQILIYTYKIVMSLNFT